MIMKDSGTVSVIVPVYNMASLLERCVNSITQQDYADLEILLVDDGSTDDSYAICHRLSVSDKRIRCIQKENGGQGSARNVALDLCTGNYIMFVDSDDYIESNCVSVLLKNLLQYDADISCGRMYRCADRTDFIEEKTIEVFDNNETMSLYVKNAKGIDQSPVAKIFKRAMFQDVYFLKLSGYEDAGTMFRPFSNANRVVSQEISVYYYYQRENSTMHRAFSKKDVDRITAYQAMEAYLQNDERYASVVSYATSSKIGAIYYVLGEVLRNPVPERRDIVRLCKKECRNTLKNTVSISRKNQVLLRIAAFCPFLFGVLYRVAH